MYRVYFPSSENKPGTFFDAAAADPWRQWQYSPRENLPLSVSVVTSVLMA
jgi:hypothetical protein